MYVQRSANEELGLMVASLMAEADESFRKRFVSAMLELPPEFWPELEKFIKKIAQDDWSSWATFFSSNNVFDEQQYDA